MGTDGIDPIKLARWSPELRERAEADETQFQRLLAGRAVDALSYDEMRAVCASFAAIDGLDNTKVRSASRKHEARYRSAQERIRRAQQPETVLAWDNEERQRAIEFAARSKALKAHKALTQEQMLKAQYGPPPKQRHRKYNASQRNRRSYA